jgi:Na+/melibiose symporter-like transporter
MTDAPMHWRDGARYGLMGFPLAFVALPLYVILPNYYARTFGIPLATLGVLLLAARLFDALIDPLLGRWSDALFARSLRSVWRWGAGAAVGLGLGFALLFFPPAMSPNAVLAWAGASLLLTYASYSGLSILHQSWGAMLGGDELKRSRIVAWREGLGLLGVVCASVAPVVWGMTATTLIFFAALLIAWLAWTQAPQPSAEHASDAKKLVTGSRTSQSLLLPFSRPAFRSLLAVFMVNGIASAVPATLLLFFVQDRLQEPPSSQAFFLGTYFICAALAIPAWLRLVGRIGLAKTWGVGMLLAIGTFAFAALLGSGDRMGFALVCGLSGIALGTDLALPGALLAGTIAANGDRGQSEGAYFGWWNFATKFNLALAAGVALPVLGMLGYAPGARDDAALRSLTMAYCLLPCGLKLVAAALLYTLIIRRTP